MDQPYSYSRRGGARVGALEGSWPFGRIEISAGSVTVHVMGRSRTLGVAEVLRVEALGLFAPAMGRGVRIYFRGQHWEEYVDFYSTFARDEVLAELRYAGFNVIESSESSES